MRITIPYVVKHYIDLTELGGSKVILSPYDLETLVVEGVRVQPKITMSTQISSSELIKAGDVCENLTYVSRELIECSAVLGFSHVEHGVAVVKDIKNYRVITKDEVFVGDTLVSDVKPGALIVAIHDGSNTHVILTSYDDYVLCRNAYKKKPVKCSLGYKIAACVFSDGRSLIIHEGKAYEIGLPVEAVASTSNGPLLRSGEWLLYADEEDLRPLVRSLARFTGFIHGLPVFREESKLKILDSGALVDYVDIVGNASAWDLVVDDLGDLVRVVDLRRKEVLRVPKDLSVACWAVKDGVLCCRGLWCGLVEAGETTVIIESLLKNHHVLRIKANTLLNVRYKRGNIKCFSECEVSEETASVLREHKFEVVLEHLLSTTEFEVVSKPTQVSVVIESAKLYVSEGIHSCGGLTYLEGSVIDLIKPERARVYLNDTELERGGKFSVCLSSYNPELNLSIVDPVTNDKISLGPLKYEIVKIPKPKVLIEVRDKESSSKISVATESGAEVIEEIVCCSSKCHELSDEVRDCRLPASIEIKTRKNNFIFNHVFNVSITPKILKCLQESFVKKEELITCRDGGFIVSYVSPEVPEIPPIHDLRINIMPRNVLISFNSRVIGRALIIGDSEVKPTQLKPKETQVILPYSDKYVVLVDAGKCWSYELRIDVRELIKVAEQHARMLAHLIKYVFPNTLFSS